MDHPFCVFAGVALYVIVCGSLMLLALLALYAFSPMED